MRHITELMDKIFSDSTSDEFKNQVSDKIEEAKANGSAELKDGDNHLSFAEADGEVLIEDKKNGNEVTKAIDSPDGTHLEAVVDDTKVKSATQPNVEVPGNQDNKKNILPAGSTENDVNVTIETGITDPEKAGVGKHFSLCFNGFESEEAANEFFSQIIESVESTEDCLTFSEDELNTVAYTASEAQANYERLAGTQDINLAFSLLETAEFLKAYSTIAEDFGHDLSEVDEASRIYSEYANQVITEQFSEMDVNEYFSELSEEEINEFFSDLDEETANILYSALMDEENNYTFSELDDCLNQVYSEAELDTPVNEVFSEMSESELDEYLNQFSSAELDIIKSVIEDNENATFSEINEELEVLNTPLNEIFSEMSEDDIKEFSEAYDELSLNICYSMVTDEENNYTYSDFLEAVEQLHTFSEGDLPQMADNANQLAKAVEDMKGSKDMELAKKVKMLADDTLAYCDIAESAGHDVSDLRNACIQYSEEASKILDEGEEKPTEAPTEAPTEEPTEVPAEDGKVEQKEKCSTFSKVFMGINETQKTGIENPVDGSETGQRVFSKTGVESKKTTINPCLTSQIN